MFLRANYTEFTFIPSNNFKLASSPLKWDFESPARQVQVDIFTISSRYDAARDDYVELCLENKDFLTGTGCFHVVNGASVIGISWRIIQNESPLTVIRALATMTPISLRAVHS